MLSSQDDVFKEENAVFFQPVNEFVESIMIFSTGKNAECQIDYRILIEDQKAFDDILNALKHYEMELKSSIEAEVNQLTYYASIRADDATWLFECNVRLDRLDLLANFLFVLHYYVNFDKEITVLDDHDQLVTYSKFIEKLNLPPPTLPEALAKRLATDPDKAIAKISTFLPAFRNHVFLLAGDLLNEKGMVNEAAECYRSITEDNLEIFQKANYALGGIYYNNASSSEYTYPREHAFEVFPFYFHAGMHGDAAEMRQRLFNCLCYNSYHLKYMNKFPYPEGATNLNAVLEIAQRIYHMNEKMAKFKATSTSREKEVEEKDEKVKWSPTLLAPKSKSKSAVFSPKSEQKKSI